MDVRNSKTGSGYKKAVGIGYRNSKWAIDVYGHMTYDEIKEKSHDIAWRSTAKDYAISLENIAREAGLDSEDIDYVLNNVQTQQAML